MSLSKDLFAEALKRIPGGVNSPVRAFKGVDGQPVFFKQGKGAYLTDVDDKQYIDYVGSWGPLILGHCHPEVIEAISQVLQTGTSFGAPTLLELKLAEKITQLMPHIEKIRMVNSGTEATMTAVRLARAVTGKQKILKFNGCYHGHSDGLLVKAGSGLLTLGLPACPGIPPSITEHTLTADFNDLDQVVAFFESHGHDIAGIIVEPIAGNMGLVLPELGFLNGLRKLCDTHQALLIFDEVMTGFRVDLHGAQALYDIQPDLTTLGKIIGGGLPVGAIGGLAQHMDYLAPLGPVYQAGTLSGNPLAMAAGLATLSALEKPGIFELVSATTQDLVRSLEDAAKIYDIPFHGACLGGMFGFYFTSKKPIKDYADVATGNESLFKCFYQAMLQAGIYFAPSMFEAGFVSAAHGQDEIAATKNAALQVFEKLAKIPLPMS